MKTTINSKNLPIPATVELHGSKVVLSGSNGRGKSTLLSCLAAAVTGYAMGGQDLAALSPTGKPSVDVFIDGTRLMDGDQQLFDLRTLAKMSGPQRAQYLFDLLGGKVTPEQIKAVVTENTPRHIFKELGNVYGEPDVDRALININSRKKEADKALDGLRAMCATVIDMDRAMCEAEIARSQEVLKDVYAERRGEVLSEMAALKADLGDKATKDTAEVHSALEEIKGESTDLADRIPIQQDEVNRLSGEMTSLRTMVTALGESNHCPTCKQSVPEGLLAKLKADYAKAFGAHKLANDTLTMMRSDLSDIRDEIRRGTMLHEKLVRLHDLRGMLETMPKGSVTAEELKDAKDRITELRAIIATHDNQEAASQRIAEVEAEAKAYRAVESALKTLKAQAAEAAGFPAEVLAIVKDVLGMTLTFAKVGRTQDICVIHDEVTRPVSTLSAGEWQVVAAAFGTLDPDAMVLVEAAEIDDDHYAKLLEMLGKHKGLVVVADCHERAVPTNWTVKEVAK